MSCCIVLAPNIVCVCVHVYRTTSSVTNGTTTTTEEVGPPIIPSVPPKEVEPAISISIFLIFVLLSEFLFYIGSDGHIFECLMIVMCRKLRCYGVRY